jgi:hypothetical protein
VFVGFGLVHVGLLIGLADLTIDDFAVSDLA